MRANYFLHTQVLNQSIRSTTGECQESAINRRRLIIRLNKQLLHQITTVLLIEGLLTLDLIFLRNN